MSEDGYEVFEDPYCYKGTFVLKNRAGLRDAVRLQAFELEMSSLRAEEPLPAGRFGPAHYRAIHRHLFGDVYSWAGRYRTVRTAKGGHVFCYPENIDGQMTMLFERLRSKAFTALDGDAAFIKAAAKFLGDLNAIHAFREGNGRTQLAFMHLLSAKLGYAMDLTRIRPQAFLDAMIASFGGDLAPLEAELRLLL